MIGAHGFLELFKIKNNEKINMNNKFFQLKVGSSVTT